MKKRKKIFISSESKEKKSNSKKPAIIKNAKSWVEQNKGFKIHEKKNYPSPRISSEIMDCSMPLTFDQYSFCSLGCLYCFSYFFKSNNPAIKENAGLKAINIDRLIKTIEGEPKDSRGRLLHKHFFSKKFLLHWGGLADPFCNFENVNNIGYPIMEALGENDYPCLFSFKGATIYNKKYIDLFSKYGKQKNFAFQISIVTNSDKISKQIEIGVLPTSKRIEALKMLSGMGYFCLDGKTEIIHKINNSPYIRKSKLRTIYKTGNYILVNHNGSWKKAKPIRIPYKGYWYKITLRNGAEIIQIAEHKNLTDVGIKLGKNLKVGDRLLISNKPMNWDCSRGDYDLGRFVGLWIAEGSGTGTLKPGFKFTFNKNEREYIQFVKSYVDKLGGYAKVKKSIKNATNVLVYSQHIKSLLDCFVSKSNSHDIALNEICYSMSKNFRYGIMAGWEEGDGNNRHQIYSESKQLIKDMFVLANTIGIKCSITKNKKNLQICDITTKNAKIYKFNPNSSPFSRKLYCEITSIKKFKKPKCRFAYSLEVPDGNVFELANGIVTHNCILRLRPFILGITDEGLSDLLYRSLEAGIQGVSMEFFALDTRANIGMKERYDWLSKFIGTDNLMKYFHDLSPRERGGYMRLNRLVKEPFVKKVYKFCIENNLVFACSDPDFKELCTSGSCCGMPDHYPDNPVLENWTHNQLTYHIKELRKMYHKKGKEKALTFDKVYKKDSTYLDDIEFTNDYVGVTGMTNVERYSHTYRTIIQGHWNNLRSYTNPRNYFHGKILPVGVDEKGNLIYKYRESEYEGRWKKEGIDLTK